MNSEDKHTSHQDHFYFELKEQVEDDILELSDQIQEIGGLDDYRLVRLSNNITKYLATKLKQNRPWDDTLGDE